MKDILPDFNKAESFIISQLEKRLSPNLLYHNVDHTLDVLRVAVKIAEIEKIPEAELHLLRIAALFHDCGFIQGYKNHEDAGCQMVRESLPQWGFTAHQIRLICNMIMATKIPQEPVSSLDRILADADLDYLGREDVYTLAQKLHDEMKLYQLLPDESKWNPFQIAFLKQHHYFTDYAKNNREVNKNRYLSELQEKLRKE